MKNSSSDGTLPGGFTALTLMMTLAHQKEAKYRSIACRGFSQILLVCKDSEANFNLPGKQEC